MPRWRLIDKTLGPDIPEPLETYHTSEHLYTDLDIPGEVGGTLPTAERTRAGLAAEQLEDVEGKRGRRRSTPRTDRSGTRRPRPPESTPEAADPSPAARQRRRRRVAEEPPSQSTVDDATSAAAAQP